MAEPKAKAAAKAIKGLPNHWQQFGLCCLFHFGFPLLPFLWEYEWDGHVSATTLTVGAAVYVLAIGASSRNMLLFGASVVLSSLYLGLFAGVKMGLATAIARAPMIVTISIAVLVITHLVERYNRHVVERSPYWEFAIKR